MKKMNDNMNNEINENNYVSNQKHINSFPQPNEKNDNVPIHNIILEQTAIAQIIINPKMLNVSDTKLDVNDFYHKSHQIIWNAINELKFNNHVIDIGTVYEYLFNFDQIESSGGIQYLNDITLQNITTANFPYYAKKIKEYSTKRKIALKTTQISNLIHNNNISDIQKEINNLNTIAQINEITKKSWQESTKYTYDKMMNIIDLNKEIPGISSGLNNIDKFVGGFEPLLYIIAARPSMGKSALMLCMAYGMAIKDLKVSIYSLEMSIDQLIQRLFAMVTGINSNKIKMPKQLNDKEIVKIIDILHKSVDHNKNLPSLSQLKFKINDKPSITPNYIRSDLQYDIDKGIPSDVIFVDYMGLMEADGKFKDNQTKISDISKNLKSISKEFNIPVIALSQLNRGVELRNDKRPMLSDLRESGSIEQDADVVMFIYRDEYYTKMKEKREDMGGESEIIIAKQRNGPTGTCLLDFDIAISKFHMPKW